MLNLEYFGEARAHQKITPGDAVTSLDPNCVTYREFFLNVHGVDAGSTEPTAGQWIVGAAGATAIIMSSVLVSGAYGNANAHVTLRIRSLSGTFVAAENAAIGSNADHFTITDPLVITPCPKDYPYFGMTAKVIIVRVFDNMVLVDWQGGIPDQTSLIGQPLGVGESVILRDANDISKFKCIDYTSLSAGVLQVTYYF